MRKLHNKILQLSQMRSNVGRKSRNRNEFGIEYFRNDI